MEDDPESGLARGFVAAWLTDWRGTAIRPFLSRFELRVVMAAPVP
jgi:hypothetical protein